MTNKINKTNKTNKTNAYCKTIMHIFIQSLCQLFLFFHQLIACQTL